MLDRRVSREERATYADRTHARMRFADFTAAPIDRQGDVWLTNEFYFRRTKLLLALVSNSVIESAIGVSRRYTGRIR
jgi:predicted NAD-dependent protein-ADP-ribosyltransferase YbiA (DUF1768 family)